jgi:hypothetical protein
MAAEIEFRRKTQIPRVRYRGLRIFYGNYMCWSKRLSQTTIHCSVHRTQIGEFPCGDTEKSLLAMCCTLIDTRGILGVLGGSQMLNLMLTWISVNVF